MATTTKIRTLGPGSLLIGDPASAQKFDADATNAVLTPKADTDDKSDFLDGTSEAGAQTVSWTLDGSIKENFSADSLQSWCFDNAGKTMPFTFVPNLDGAIGFSGDVLIAPLAVGGDVKKKNDQDFSFTATNVKKTDNAGGTATPPATDPSGSGDGSGVE